MERIHVKTCFSLFLPLKSEYVLLPQADLVTEPTFGLSLATNPDSRIFFKLRLFCKQRVTAKEYEQQHCLCWAKRSPAVKKTDDEQQQNPGFVLRLKVKQGAFDFRKVDKRFIRLQIECSNSEGQLLHSATSQYFQLLPRKRKHDNTPLGGSEVIIPLQWQNSINLVNNNQHEGERISSTLAVSREIQPANLAHEEWGAHIDGSPSNTMQLHEGSNSDDHIPLSSDESEQDYYQYTSNLMHDHTVHSAQYDIVMPRANSQYMVLYNGNAEVVGNFRALNFYKASDINIKEDIRLLMEEHDPRDVLLKIDGVSYKFKPGTTHSTQRRFVGYIAQQIESVVPEAVQLIDGILHVDYESLIPYLSESIKQNYNDIKRSHVDIDSIKSEQDRIIALVDMLYNTFLQHERKYYCTDKRHVYENQQSSPTRWPRVLLILLGVVFTLSAVLVGLYFALDYNSFGNDIANTPLSPDSKHIPLTPLTSNNTSDTPLSPDSTSIPLTPLGSYDTKLQRHALEDLYHATYGPFWNFNSSSRFKWLSDAPICRWYGVECLDDGRVRSIKLVAINLQGTIPHSIGYLTLLDTLDLMQNSITGTIPDSIGNLISLQYLSLAQNNLSGTIPPIIKLRHLTYLILDENPNLSGTIPDLPHMITNIYISQCNLHGTIPQRMSTLQHLTNIMLDHNQLSGTIPPLLFQLIFFPTASVNLSNNLLEGTLPSFFSEHQPLSVSLDVSNNLLSGTLKNLANVDFTELVLHNNQFSGEVGYFETQVLTYLDISNNNFTSFNSSFSGVENPVCNASNNPFQCPIPHWVEQNCKATCINN